MNRDRTELERLDREALVQRAQAAGVRRARLLTRPELVDELLRLDPNIDPAQLKKSRGFFGRARDLLSRVVERGLHLPDAADRLRAALGNAPPPDVPRPEAQAVPTVTLAEIYAAQGHKQRAIETLRRVLKVEPDHGAARKLLERLEAADYVAPEPPLPPEREPETEEPPTEEPVTEFQGIDEPVTLKRNRPDLAARDECVAVPVSADSTYVWWRLSEATWRLLSPDGDRSAEFFVRVIVLRPTWDGPEEQIRDAACDPSAGELLFHLAPLPPGAVLRVAIGTSGSKRGGFVPLAHSPALERLPEGDREAEGERAGDLAEWTLEGLQRIAESDPRWSSITTATARSEAVAARQ
jgi:hypothetical protein